MAHSWFIVILICLIRRNVVAAGSLTELIEKYHPCENLNITEWIFFPYGRCIQIIFEDNATDALCRNEISHQLTNIAVYTKSLSYVKNQSIYHQHKSNCESFLILSDHHHAIFELFNSTLSVGSGKFIETRRFFPFSRLYFMFPNDTNLSTLQKYLYSNALFGYNLIRDSRSDEITSIQDLLSKAYTQNHHPNVTDLNHPFINLADTTKVFTISVYNCSPSVTYHERIGDDFSPFTKARYFMITRKDGLEYRYINSVLRNWKTKFIHQNESQKPFTPHTTMFYDLGNRSSQLVMCSVWQNVGHLPKWDLTNYFDYHCHTWVCPKPIKLNAATAVYRTLDSDVWVIYGFCFALTVAVLTTISQLESKLKKKKITSTKISRCLLETVNIATSHGTVHIPQISSIQILLSSWILLNLLVGVGYTTIYASRLASPSYTRPIDTIEDFVKQDLYWASRHSFRPIRRSLNASKNPFFNNMNTRFVYFETENQLYDALKTRKYGVLSTLLQNHKAMDIEGINEPDSWKFFRFMKTCSFGFFTTFALNKHSPYTILFNANMRKYQESGIIKHWSNELFLNIHWMDTLFESHEIHSSVPRTLNMIDVSGSFLVLVFGLCAALIVFICECTINNIGFK